jgi:plastocyanin
MKKNVTPLHRILKSGLLLLLASVFLPARAQTSHIVDVTNNIFTPDQLTVSVGDTVVWTNSEGFHNVNGTQGSYPSNPESFGNETGVGWTFSHVFTVPGTYDYQCDPHVGWGMVGQVVVGESVGNMLTINFTGMTPHVGQTLWLVVEDRDESEEILRMSRLIEASFTVEVPGIVAGNDYRVEFFADHNGNGSYDDPPTDHAWRLEFESSAGDDTLDFVHNTDFTDIFETTGIPGTSKDPQGLSLYPNPAKEFIYLESEAGIETVTIYDTRGSRVLDIADLRSTMVTIPLEGIRSGVYFVEVRTVERILFRSRLVKQ